MKTTKHQRESEGPSRDLSCRDERLARDSEDRQKYGDQCEQTAIVYEERETAVRKGEMVGILVFVE
jgi:hypothetical protein